MTAETVIEHALDRVTAEQEVVVAKASAVEQFTDRLTAISPTQATQERATQTVGGQLMTSGGTDERATVRTAFAETVAEHVETSSTLDAVQIELGDGVALALAPTTQTAFTLELKEQVLTATRNRQRELAVTEDALGSEVDQVESATETVRELCDWLATADETPLTALDFDALRARHEQLDEWTSQLDDIATARQSFLRATTSSKAQVGVDNHDLVVSVYEDFAVDHPVLSTIASLQTTLSDCQAIVRDHLVRRT